MYYILIYIYLIHVSVFLFLLTSTFLLTSFPILIYFLVRWTTKIMLLWPYKWLDAWGISGHYILTFAWILVLQFCYAIVDICCLENFILLFAFSLLCKDVQGYFNSVCLDLLMRKSIWNLKFISWESLHVKILCLYLHIY